MRSRCLVVSHASPSSSTPFFVCATLGLALWLGHGPAALAEATFSITSASFRAGGAVNSPQVFDQDDCKGARVFARVAQSIPHRFSIRTTAKAATARRN